MYGTLGERYHSKLESESLYQFYNKDKISRASKRKAIYAGFDESGIKKTDFCICENKDSDQLCSYCTTDQRLCFRYTNRTVSLLLKTEISNFLAFISADCRASWHCVGPGQKLHVGLFLPIH